MKKIPIIERIHPLIKEIMDLERYAMKNHYWFALKPLNKAKNQIGNSIAIINAVKATVKHK